MHIPKKYLHDKIVLLLVSINVFLTFLVVVIVLLKAGLGQGVDSYIIEYRANQGLSAFQKGNVLAIFSFVLFALVVAVANIVLSIRTYHLRRALSLTILGLGVLILLLAVIVSNALLASY
ncbi:MAG TPA: hypothetical protein VD735_06440 [Candidatus Saccharimonadales bacterium]|nr:hypothetical protein [Candidatus Saccharimonadales bacterium]